MLRKPEIFCFSRVIKLADNDIYNSKERYETFKQSIDQYLSKPNGYRKFHILFPENIRHFHKLCLKIDARDLSYIRRLRICRTFLMVCHYINKDLTQITRDDIDLLMLNAHRHNSTPMSKRCFIRDIKFVWKILFPDVDHCGRIDDSIAPYVVRHLSCKIDKSTQKLRTDRLTMDEFDKLLEAFADDVRMQALISFSFESLGRPQEILGRKLKDIELFDNYAKVTISEHGKEGIGILRSIDSYHYLSKWYNQHPLKGDPNAYLFINLGTRRKYGQLKPTAANVLLKRRCRRLGIDKPITLYSLKRNGVTFCRLRGDSDVDIQHRARWTSTKQLKTYDLSHQEDSFRLELIKRGVISADEKSKDLAPRTKTCSFCQTLNGVAEVICSTCQRPLDRKAIEQEIAQKGKEQDALHEQLAVMQQTIARMADREERRTQYDGLLKMLLELPEAQRALKEKIKEGMC